MKSSKITDQFAAPGDRSSFSDSSTVKRGHQEMAARRLRIYGLDPQLGRRRKFRMKLEIPYEKLESLPGYDHLAGDDRPTRPKSRMVDVIDYNASSNRDYPWVWDLGGGLGHTSRKLRRQSLALELSTR
jgi:hypothetical protein